MRWDENPERTRIFQRDLREQQPDAEVWLWLSSWLSAGLNLFSSSAGACCAMRVWGWLAELHCSLALWLGECVLTNDLEVNLVLMHSCACTTRKQDFRFTSACESSEPAPLQKSFKRNTCVILARHGNWVFVPNNVCIPWTMVVFKCGLDFFLTNLSF